MDLGRAGQPADRVAGVDRDVAGQEPHALHGHAGVLGPDLDRPGLRWRSGLGRAEGRERTDDRGEQGDAAMNTRTDVRRMTDAPYRSRRDPPPLAYSGPARPGHSPPGPV